MSPGGKPVSVVKGKSALPPGGLPVVVLWPPNTGYGGGPDAPIFQPDGGVPMPVGHHACGQR